MHPASAEWRFATRSDARELQCFECADPPKPYKSAETQWKPYHPRHWEYDAQQLIRSLAKQVTQRGATRILVGTDGEGLAGVASWTELDGPGIVHLDVLGIASRHRRQQGERRGAFAREMCRETFSRIEAAAIEADAGWLYIEGEIYNANDASMNLCAEMGMRPIEQHVSGAQTWSIRLPLGADYLSGG